MAGECYRQAEDVVARRIGSAVVLVPIRRRVGDLESVFTLNDVGAYIWDLCDGTRGAQEITDAVVREYDVTTEEAAQDAHAFLLEMTEAGMLAVRAR